MKLTLALPSLNRFADESVPALALPAFNCLLRYGILRKETLRPSEFYGRHLWNGSLITQVQRGNPTRTFNGSDFKSTYVEKSYKKERAAAKKKISQFVDESICR